MNNASEGDNAITINLNDDGKLPADVLTKSTGCRDEINAISHNCVVHESEEKKVPEESELKRKLSMTSLDGIENEENTSLSSLPINTSVPQDEGSLHDSLSSCMTVSTSGSFGVIKAAFFDEMSRMSNHRCGKRLARPAIEAVDTEEQVIKNLVKSGAFGEASDDLSEASSATASSFGSFGLIKKSFCDEAKRISNRRMAKRRLKGVPTEIVVSDDSTDHISTSSNDIDASNCEERRAARNRSNDDFEKAQRIEREKAEAEVKQNCNSESHAKRVSFSTVEVRQYERILGDHPSCSTGPPLSIGWEHDVGKTRRQSVDEHELQCWNDQSELRRLSREQRYAILLDLGFSGKELVHAIRIIKKEKKKRNQTSHNLHFEKVEEMAESAKRKIKKSLKTKKDPCDAWTRKIDKGANVAPSFNTNSVMLQVV